MLNPREALNVADLLDTEVNQAEKSKSEKTYNAYLSQVITMSIILKSIIDYRKEALIFEEDGEQPLKYHGRAKNVFQFVLPMTLKTLKCLFSAIANDTTLNKVEKKRLQEEAKTAEDARNRRSAEVTEVVNLTDDPEAEEDAMATTGGAKTTENKPTCVVQTYKNFISALKWFHGYKLKTKTTIFLVKK